MLWFLPVDSILSCATGLCFVLLVGVDDAVVLYVVVLHATFWLCVCCFELCSLEACHTCCELQISWCTLMTQDMNSLASAFPALSSLQVLSLQYCWTPNSAAPTQVASALSSLKSLTRLNLAQSALCEHSCSGFVEAAAHLSSLKELCMAHNDLLGQSVGYIAQALSVFTCLTHLDLSHCSFCDSTAETLFQSVQNMPQLLYLDVSSAGDVGGTARTVWSVVAASISGILSLRTMILNGCQISALDTGRIVGALQSLSELRRVDLRDNNLGAVAVKAVQEMRSCCLDASGSACYVLT